MIDDASRQAASGVLMQARETRMPVPPLTETWPGFDVEDAYAVQRLGIASREAGGARRVGWKVGITSLAMQQQLGVDEPDFGPLLDAMETPDGGECDAATLIAPRIEGELAFRLSRDLRGPDVTLDEALAAVDLVLPALEIIDSRVADWRIALPDTIADHASAAGFVIGGPGVAPADVDLVGVELRIEQDGVEVDRGTGAAVLGHPVRAVAWLANTLAPYGDFLSAGEIVLAGAVHAAVPVVAGTTITVRCPDPIGAAAVTFVSRTGDSV